MLDYTVQYCNFWRDDMIVLVYENEECFQNDSAKIVRVNKSKKSVLKNISETENITEEMVFLLEKLNRTFKIIVFDDEKKAILVTDQNSLTISYITDTFINVLTD